MLGQGSGSLRAGHRQPDSEDHRKRGEHGYDGAKRISGRKRHIAVDTGGYLVEVKVHSAEIQDRDGAVPLLQAAKPKCPRVKTIFADAGYTGRLKAWLKGALDWDLLIVKRPKFKRRLFGREMVLQDKPTDEKPSFPILPKRWVVERTFAWLGRYRRLSKDYEQLCRTGETLIRMASVRLITSRFAHGYF